MDRSRSKRGYHYDLDSPPSSRSKPRFDRRGPPGHHYNRRPAAGGGGGGGGGDRRFFSGVPPDAPPPPSAAAGAAPAMTTFFRILCPETKVHAFPAAAVEAIREETGAWVTVHPPAAGDPVRVIEAADTARREPDGRPPLFSPAQDALIMVHRRILDAQADNGDDDDEEAYGRRERDRGKITTRLVVPRLHVGCLLGKGGKIIEQMRIETKTHIRILPRDQHTPRCVSMSEEVVQIVGEGNCVKRALAIISDRLKESLHRDRGPFRGRMHSPEHRISQDDEFLSGGQHLSAMEESYGGPDQIRSNSCSLEPPGYAFDANGSNKMNDHVQFSYEDIIFRILCPSNKVESFVGSSTGIIEMLQADVGVDVRVSDAVAGSDERIIIITSKEDPEDVLFPAQEALLHIQTHIVDLGPDKDNIITTRLLIPSSDIACFEGRDGSLSDIQRLTSANVQLLPKEDLPLCALESDELIQIVGDIRAARNALMQVTAKLRSCLYQDTSGPNQAGKTVGHEINFPVKGSPQEGYQGNDLPVSAHQQVQPVTTSWHSKDSGGSASGSFEQGSNVNDDVKQTTVKRYAVPLVTRSTLEVVIPKSAVPSLTMRSGSKLAQISEMSGATVTLIEDRPDLTERVVQISGSPEQADKAQSLLQGFILSIQDDIPSS